MATDVTRAPQHAFIRSTHSYATTEQTELACTSVLPPDVPHTPDLHRVEHRDRHVRDQAAAHVVKNCNRRGVNTLKPTWRFPGQSKPFAREEREQPICQKLQRGLAPR